MRSRGEFSGDFDDDIHGGAVEFWGCSTGGLVKMESDKIDTAQ
jgi:hypothetical protein